jgi:hypothetical protein
MPAMSNPETSQRPLRHEHAEAFGLPGGPAFPIGIPGVGDNGGWGMSLRDYFAGQAMASGLGKEMSGTGEYFDRIAINAYAVADAMLRARKST